MMATEATLEKIVITSKLPDNELMTTTEHPPKSYDVPSDKHDLKFDKIKRDSHLTLSKLNSTAVSVNGGSDSEASKAEISKSEGEEKSHLRTTSTVKKLTSFKPVSVNKKFLAAKGTANSTPSKLGDSGLPGSTTAQVVPLVGGSTARPRLVAKSGPGLHSTPRAAATSNGSRVSGAPDANAVWNKNRPAPPPEPKRFTDEELKQRYGIHLATRIQTDDAGKQATWADIDDDDEDWAPNTMEWADGTKVTLPKVDESSTPAPTSTPGLTPAPKPTFTPAPTSPLVEPDVATIYKGKAVEPIKPKSPAPSQVSTAPSAGTMGFYGRAGLVLKGVTEKPTLVAKPLGPPTPVKSPWAPLPPVEKVAPTLIEAPQQQQTQQGRLNQRDPHGFQGMPPPQAKEIAADDFSRSWREAPCASRELYNAQSGRYEPANDNRRGSMRSDTRSHQPALLQRQQDSPAEPSPAFQTHRFGTQDNHPRRRNSSNVSGMSENVMKRISRGDMSAQETPAVRKESFNAVSDEVAPPSNVSSLTQNVHQRNQQNQTWQSRALPTANHSSPQLKHGQLIPTTDTSAVNQTQNSPISYEDLFEFQKKEMQLKRELAIARRREEKEQEEAERKERIRIKLESMGPSPDKKKDSPKDSPNDQKSLPTQIQVRDNINVASDDSKVVTTEVIVESSPGLLDSKEPKPLVSTAPGPNSVNKYAPPDARPNSNQLPKGLTPQNQPSKDVRHPQSWQGSSSENFKPWASAPSQQSSSRNVWGPPTNDRTLGNGTFNPELSRVPEIPAHPGPIGPLNRRRQGQGISEDLIIRSAVANAGWISLPNKIAEDDARRAHLQEIEMSRARELREKGLLTDPAPPVVQDTWRQVCIKEDGTRSQIKSSHTTFHNEPAQLWKGQEESKTARGMFEEQDDSQLRQLDTISSQSHFSDAWRSTSNVNVPLVRGSRFFPNNRDIRLEDHVVTFDRPESPSPPPPTQLGHPAYDGDVSRPHVSLPRPVPVVKLPPPKVLAPIGPPKPISFAAVLAAPAVSVKNKTTPRQATRVSQFPDPRREEPVAGNWQEKINTLFGRKSSLLKSNALAVDSSSKNALEVPRQLNSATVYLPSFGSVELETETGSVESKPAADVCFEEQEMGSLPRVKLPVKPPTTAWDLAPPPKPLSKKFMVLQITTVESISFPPQTVNNSITIRIKIPGQFEAKNVSLFITRQKSNPRRGGNRVNGGQRHSSSSHQRARGRDTTNGFQSTGVDHAAPASSLSSSSRGRVRGNGSNWKRQTVAPIET